LRADFAWLRVTTVRNRLPGPRVWAIFRRSLTEPSETKYFLCNAPIGITPRTMADMSGHRWPIETIFEEAKGEVGMDHYETRTWAGWHHHMAQTFLAHHFLIRVRAQLKKSPALTTAQARQLVAQIIDTDKCQSEVFDLIEYHQQRNYAAYQSHRKHTLQQHQKRGSKPKKSKVSL